MEVMSWCTNSRRSLLCLLSVWTWMSRGHAAMSWLVFICAPYFVPGLCGSNLLLVSAHHPEWAVPAGLVSLHQLGKVTRKLQPGVWGGSWQSVSSSSHVGHRNLPESMCGIAGLLQQRSSWGNSGIGSNSRCTWAWRVGGVNQRRVYHSRGSLLQVSGQWVPSEADWLAVLWSSPV